MNSYELSRGWFDWSFENPEKINPNHSAIFFFAIEHCNRLGWRDKFGFPTQMAMDAVGIKKYDTYIKYFNQLVEWGFFKLVQKSVNQYSSNIISLQSAHPKNGKALSKAILNHTQKQTESNGESKHESNGSIDKPNNHKPNNLITIEERKLKFADNLKIFNITYDRNLLLEFYKYWTEPNKSNTKFRMELEKTWDLTRRLENWAKNDKSFTKQKATEIPKIDTSKNTYESKSPEEWK